MSTDTEMCIWLSDSLLLLPLTLFIILGSLLLALALICRTDSIFPLSFGTVNIFVYTTKAPIVIGAFATLFTAATAIWTT